MKFLKPSILSLFIGLFSSYAFANNNFQITCDHNAQALSDQFIANQWTKTEMPWYASWAQEDLGSYTFSGGMRTIKDKYPDDQNPHLTFLNAVVVYDDERGEVIMCRYAIHNPELMDINNVLEMRAPTYLPKRACVATSVDTVKCRDNG